MRFCVPLKAGTFLHAFIILCAPFGAAAFAAEADTQWVKPSWFPQLLGAQVNAIYQNAPGFHSPYTGPDSFVFDHTFKQQLSHIYGLYFGSQVTRSFQSYFDFEMFRGDGISEGYGLGGYTNGDVIRAGPADIGHGPYLARLYGRYLVPLSGAMTEPIERNVDQLPGRESADRIEIKGGILAPSDDFDQNRYANNMRTQFLNYDFLY